MLIVMKDKPTTCILDFKIVSDSIMKPSTIKAMYKILLFVVICFYLFVMFLFYNSYFMLQSVSNYEYSNKNVLV